MSRSAILVVFLAVLLCPALGHSSSAFGEGSIDDDLTFEGFQLTPDGFVTGYIVNATGAAKQGLNLELRITNPQETRVFWSKPIAIASLGPKSRVLVKEPIGAKIDFPERIKFMIKDNSRKK